MGFRSTGRNRQRRDYDARLVRELKAEGLWADTPYQAAAKTIRRRKHELMAVKAGAPHYRGVSYDSKGVVASSYWGDGIAPEEDTVSLRISDHPQKAGGGFHAGKGKRMGESCVSIDPSTWKGSIEETIRWAAAEVAAHKGESL